MATLTVGLAPHTPNLPDAELAAISELTDEINEFKAARNAVVLAHNYMSPDIYHTVADYVGDSLGLAEAGRDSDAEVIVMAGVKFMAETAKILAYDKTILLPDLEAGCSLAQSITGADVRALKAAHPGVPVVTYVNTNADVKAETDVCCTSANALAVVEALERDGHDTLIFIPDRYLRDNIARHTNVTLIGWDWACEVHERFDASHVAQIRALWGDDTLIYAHPECPTSVTQAADMCGSTGAMSAHIAEVKPRRIALITECSMSDNLAIAHPDVEIVRPCALCPHMRRITLSNIRDALANNQHEITLDEQLANQARRAVDAMLDISRKEPAA